MESKDIKKNAGDMIQAKGKKCKKGKKNKHRLALLSLK